MVSSCARMSLETRRPRGQGVAVDRHLARQVAPVDLVLPGLPSRTCHLVQPHDARRCRRRCCCGEGQPLEVLGACARRGEPHVHVVGLVVRRAPVAHGLAGHQRAQERAICATDRPRSEAASRRTSMSIVGLSGLTLESRSTSPGRPDALDHQGGQPLQFLQVGALQRELDLLVAADRVEQARVRHGDAGHLLEAFAQHADIWSTLRGGPCGPPAHVDRRVDLAPARPVLMVASVY